MATRLNLPMPIDELDDRGRNKRQEAYSKELSEGYIFQTNSDLEEVDDRVRKYKSQGFEVILKDEAFYEDGRINPRMKAILIRKVLERE